MVHVRVLYVRIVGIDYPVEVVVARGGVIRHGHSPTMVVAVGRADGADRPSFRSDPVHVQADQHRTAPGKAGDGDVGRPIDTGRIVGENFPSVTVGRLRGVVEYRRAREMRQRDPDGLRRDSVSALAVSSRVDDAVVERGRVSCYDRITRRAGHDGIREYPIHVR